MKAQEEGNGPTNDHNPSFDSRSNPYDDPNLHRLSRGESVDSSTSSQGSRSGRRSRFQPIGVNAQTSVEPLRPQPGGSRSRQPSHDLRPNINSSGGQINQGSQRSNEITGGGLTSLAGNEPPSGGRGRGRGRGVDNRPAWMKDQQVSQENSVGANGSAP